MSIIIALYFVGLGVTLFVCGIWMIGVYIESDDYRAPVRYILLSPIWPLVVPFALFRVITWAFNIDTSRFRKMFMY